MTKPIKIKFYSDPGHGWGAVKRTLLEQYGILDKISLYSYQKGGTVYLEEDCDMATLINTLKAAGVAYTYEEHNTNRLSPIRNYDRFVA